jgi:myosin heavy subunit
MNTMKFPADEQRNTFAITAAILHASNLTFNDGFGKKNRDELPKESIELMQHSSNPFVRDLAGILENSSGCVRATCDDNTTLTPFCKLHRADSSVVTRSTVGGQFRRQLRDLRTTIRSSKAVGIGPNFIHHGFTTTIIPWD